MELRDRHVTMADSEKVILTFVDYFLLHYENDWGVTVELKIKHGSHHPVLSSNILF